MASETRVGAPIPRSRLADEVARRLEAEILQGDYAVGERLPAEKDLAVRFGVGRSSMREAVRTLQAAGYLRSDHGVGVFVVSDAPQRSGAVDQSLPGGYTMRDLFETRVAIEGKAAQLAAERRTPEQCDAIRRTLAEADGNISDAEFVALDGQFHRLVAEASGNRILLHVWDSLAAQFEEYSLRVIGMPGRRGRAHSDHRSIAEALFIGDAAEAARRAQEHVMTVQREVGPGAEGPRL